MQGNLLHHNDPFTLVVLFPMQVKKSGIEAVEIPEHEVVTRRKQFRMKKDKAQARQTKKEQKAKDAEEKKALKESKKADREAKKLEKEAKKKLEKEAKKSKKHAKSSSSKVGRNAAEKLKERKNGKGKGKGSKKMIPKKDPNPAEGLHDDSSFPTWDPEEVFPVKSKQLNRLRHFKSLRKAASMDQDRDSKSFDKAKEDGEEKVEEKVEEKAEEKVEENIEEKVDEDMTPIEKNVKKGKKTDQKKSGAKVSKKDSTKGSKAKVTKQTSTSKRKSMEEEDRVKSKRKTKQEKASRKKAKLSPKTPKTPNGSRPRALKPKKVHPVDEVAKEVALKTLQECDTSGCCHPSFQQPAGINGLEYSTYWSRGAVGVKVDRRFMQNKKAKGKGKSQIAYFGTNSPCTYASWEIASLYVSRLQPGCVWLGFSLVTGSLMD